MIVNKLKNYSKKYFFNYGNKKVYGHYFAVHSSRYEILDMIKEYDPLIPAGLIYVPEYYSDKYLYYINEKLQNNDVVDFISINLKNSLSLFSSCKFDYSKYKILGYCSGDFRKLKAEDATIRRCLSNMPNDKFTNIIIENFN